MKRYIILGMMALAIATTNGFGETTFDCGHGCKITCPDGGGCVYNHKTGICVKFCNEHGDIKLQAEGKEKPAPIAKDAKLTIRFEGVTPGELQKALAQLGIH